MDFQSYEWFNAGLRTLRLTRNEHKEIQKLDQKEKVTCKSKEAMKLIK